MTSSRIAAYCDFRSSKGTDMPRAVYRTQATGLEPHGSAPADRARGLGGGNDQTCEPLRRARTKHYGRYSRIKSVVALPSHISHPQFTSLFIDILFRVRVSVAATAKKETRMKFKNLITATSLALLPLTAGAATLIVPAAATTSGAS